MHAELTGTIGRKLKRAYVRLISDIAPRGLNRLGYHIPQPHGRLRPPSQDFCMRVPFGGSARLKGRPGSIAVVCHIFHEDLAPWLFQAITNIEHRADIFISTDTPSKKSTIEAVFSQWDRGLVDVRLVENRGRDIAPKIVAFADVYDSHDLILFLHSKKTTHKDYGNEWRDYLVDCLTGSPQIVDSILGLFEHAPEVGMVAPQHYRVLRDRELLDWGPNFYASRRLAWRMDIDVSAERFLDLPSGSMFWARSDALKPLLALKLRTNDFQEELGQLDMTLAHCIERLFLHVCERAGFTWVKVTSDGTKDETIVPVVDGNDISRFIAQHRFDLT